MEKFESILDLVVGLYIELLHHLKVKNFHQIIFYLFVEIQELVRFQETVDLHLNTQLEPYTRLLKAFFEQLQKVTCTCGYQGASYSLICPFPQEK